MAISRGTETQSGDLTKNETLIPDDTAARDTSRSHQTSDYRQVEKQYSYEAESVGGGFNTGALIPRDMTVKLVRAETATWETFLSVLYSLTLTLFGLFLGAWVTSSSAGKSWTSLEAVATISFGSLSVILIAAWAVIKVRQQRHGVVVPYEVLSTYRKTEQEATPDARPSELAAW